MCLSSQYPLTCANTSFIYLLFFTCFSWLYFFWAPKSLQVVIAAMKLKKYLFLERRVITNLDSIFFFILLFFFICSEFCHTLKWNRYLQALWLAFKRQKKKKNVRSLSDYLILQAYLWDIASSVPDHHNKANIT